MDKTYFDEAPWGPEEEKIVDQIVEANRRMMKDDEGRLFRAQHPKGHGYVKARFHVRDDIPAALRQGIFAEPGAFDALIRFSNGNQMDDREQDAHGMAIKIFGLSGEKLIDSGAPDTADIVLVDNETFFAGDLEEYRKFNDIVADVVGAVRNRTNLARGVLSLIYLKSIRRLTKKEETDEVKEFTDQTPTSPLRAVYWSATPYRLGDQVVKYQASPNPEPIVRELEDSVSGEHGLAEALRAGLQGGPARFEFTALVRRDAAATPIEDPTETWLEGKSEAVRLAEIEIPQIKPMSAEDLKAEGEEMKRSAFNPWNTFDVNRPLGAINRARLRVYETLAAERR